jgi:hypothetical protein
MKNFFRKYDFYFQADRDLMIWTSRDMVFSFIAGLIIGAILVWM